MKIELNRDEILLLFMAMDSWRRKVDVIHRAGLAGESSEILIDTLYDYETVLKMINKLFRASLDAIVEEAHINERN